MLSGPTHHQYPLRQETTVDGDEMALRCVLLCLLNGALRDFIINRKFGKWNCLCAAA